jgi:hypothetical protein
MNLISTDILIICICILFIWIFNLKTNLEHLKNNQSYTYNYLNDPYSIINFKNKQRHQNLNLNTFKTVDLAQSNFIIDTDKSYIPQEINISNLKPSSKISSDIFKLENINNSNNVSNGNEYRIKSNSDRTKSNSNRTKSNLKHVVNFNPINTQSENKYKLYHDNLFNFGPAGIVGNTTKPHIDQTINTNIMNYAEKGIVSDPKNNLIMTETNSTEGKTIKQIYDDITNDNRLSLQQNLDNLEARDKGKNYLINEKYGATRFDTYNISDK